MKDTPSLKEFLFGGTQDHIDGCNTFTDDEYFKDTYSTFEEFKGWITLCLHTTGWDTNSEMALDIDECDIDFDVPDDEILRQWYNERLLKKVDSLV
jgi:hypothetical protein